MRHRQVRVLGAGVAVALSMGIVVAGAAGPATARSKYHWSTTSRHGLLAAVQQTLGEQSVLINGTVHVTGAVSGDAQFQGGLDLASKVGDLNVSFNFGPATGSVHTVLSGGTLYLQIPTGQWYSISLGSLEHSVGPTGSLFGEGDPTTFLQMIQQVGGQVAQTGTSTLSDGTTVTNYHVLVNLDAVSAAGPANGRPAIPAAALRKLETLLGSHSIAFDVSVDPQGRVRSFATNLTLDPSALGQRAVTGPLGIAVNVSLSGYGSPVSVSPPPPSEVKPLPAGALSRGGLAI